MVNAQIETGFVQTAVVFVDFENIAFVFKIAIHEVNCRTKSADLLVCLLEGAFQEFLGAFNHVDFFK